MEWTIQELADKVGVTSHTLRYYEKIGLLRNIRRNENGVRVYTEYDLSWLELIRCLRNTGMPIEGIRQIVELSMQGDHTIPARKQILREHRRKVEQQMEELKNYLDKIDGKLKWYSEQMPD
jgi:DNA-binding transcriptional MerR regulator